MTPSGQPRFVVIEGLDGAGTTTQADLLAEGLRGRDLRVCLTAEPSDGPLGAVARAHVRNEISLDPVTTALTFVADRADHAARVIGPALERGEWVVCDRYLLSTLAYQGAEGVDRLWMLEASAGILVPDLTVYLDVPDRQRAERMSSRAGADRYEGAELQTALGSAYAESIDLLRSRGYRISQIDGTGDPPLISARILAELDALT
jgi:dTMP kinase